MTLNINNIGNYNYKIFTISFSPVVIITDFISIKILFEQQYKFYIRLS